MHPLPITSKAWVDISMDFIEVLPMSKGSSVIMVIVDMFNKYSHFILMEHPYMAATVAKVFMENIFKLHGIQQSIVSDRDAIFTSNFLKEIFHLIGTKLLMNSTYHPQTEQTEVMNKWLEGYLRCFTRLGQLASFSRVGIQYLRAFFHKAHPLRDSIWIRTTTTPSI